ncbi:hypothetical protein P4O66_012288 [Electrophorus voltai]|uniref:Uncharacterized protein n=1 Tax=Electrophorus voltai TaxID=2609070 RepID=A0AAD8Z6L5_9TELE|nr:hypothetical protein P4O66_012288 [Electrophorus voltai]
MLGQAVRRFATSVVRSSHYAEGPGQRLGFILATNVHGCFAESAILSREQMEATGWYDVILRQWFCLPLRRSQTPDPEEVKFIPVSHGHFAS